MNRLVRPALLVLALHTTACIVHSTDDSHPCEPSPCTQANRSVCVEEAGEARCLCDSGFVSRPSGACELVSASNCAEHSGDAAEPDDCQARAHPLSSGGTAQEQSIDPIGDYDFFQFTTTARSVYALTAKAQGSLLPRVDVFDQGGEWLGSSEAPGRAELFFKARVASVHFARVSHSPVDPSAATGAYTLTLTSLGAEDHGDSPDEATHLTPESASTTTPSSIPGRFEYSRDEDWFTFSGDAGRTYQLLFDSTRTVPALAVFSSANLRQPLFTAQQADVSFALPSSGTFFIVLDPPQSTAGTYAFNFLVN